jgi:hypothetical protein
MDIPKTIPTNLMCAIKPGLERAIAGIDEVSQTVARLHSSKSIEK